jgi:hypothetical protein
LQPGLVGLGEEQVVAAPRHDGRAGVALAEQGVADDEAAPDRQQAQRLPGGLVLVGLGIDLHLDQDGFDQRGVGSDQVLSG